MQPDEIDRTLQQFLASVAGIERSRLAAVLLANLSTYLTAFHAQVGDPQRAPGLHADDATTMGQILELVTDAGSRVTLADVGSALQAASLAKAIPMRLTTDWQDARSRIAGYLAEAGPLPSAPRAADDESPSAFREARQVTREGVLHVVIDGGILANDPELA